MVAGASCLLLAVMFTNVQQIVNMVMTDAIVRQMPTNDYSTPHLTLLSHERALPVGDYSNMFYACSLKCRRDDIGVTSLGDVPINVITEFSRVATNAIGSACVEARELSCTTNHSVVILKNREMRSGVPVYEQFRYELTKEGNEWKIDEWEDLLPNEEK